MSRYRAGAVKEHKTAEHLRSEYGMVVYRSAGSHGNADLIALKIGLAPWLVQVKGNAGSPWDHFRPAERLALEHEAIAAGAVPYLCHWPPYGRPTFYGRFEWPGNHDPIRTADEFDLRLQAAG